MKVLILNYSLKAQGGSQMTSISIAEELRRRGCEVTYGAESGPMVERLRESGIGFLELPLNRDRPHVQNLSVDNVRRLATFVRRERIDIIHSFQYFLMLAARLATVFRPTPLLLTLLGPNPPSHRLPPGVSHVFAVSEELRDRLIAQGRVLGTLVSILPHRIDLHRYGQPRGGRALAEALGMDPRAKVVCMVSTLTYGKIQAIRIFLDACRRLAGRRRDVQFLLGGDGPFHSEVEGIVEDINRTCGRKAVLLPGVLHMPACLDLADVMVGMGRSAMESMAAGLPTMILGPYGYVAMASERSLPFLAYTNFTGRGSAPVDDPGQEAAAQIDRALTEPEEAARIAQQGREFVLARYDLAEAGEILESAYRRLLGSPRSPSPVAGTWQLARFGASSVLLSMRRRAHAVRQATAGADPGQENA